MTLVNPKSIPDTIRDEINRMAEGIANSISDVSKISYLGRGGSARVLSYECKEGKRAIKILAEARVDFQDSVEAFNREYQIIKKLQDIHGVVQVYEIGNLNNSLGNRYYTMECSELGPLRNVLKDSSSFLAKEVREVSKNLSQWTYKSLQSLLETLAQLHEKGYCHLDIKEHNILLFKEGNRIIAKLHDFGSAQEIIETDSEKEIQVTYLYAPREWQDRTEIKSASSHQRVSLKAKSSEILPWIDLHMVGVMMRQLLRDDKVYDRFRISLDNDDIEIMLAFAETLGRESRLPSNQHISNATEALKHLEAAMESDLRVEKLIGRGTRSQPIVPLKHFSKKISDVVNMPLFQRLRELPQLSITHKIFQSAVHNRLEHSLGVFQNACDMLDALLGKSGSPWLRIFSQERDIRETLAAALVHDLGQYPLAHYIEGQYPFKNHAELTEEMIYGKEYAKRLFGEDGIIEFRKKLNESMGVDPDAVANLLKSARTRESLTYEDNYIQHALGTILDGPIDADKIDYLARDAHHCGVPYGNLINRELLINCLTINTSARAAGTIERFVLSVKEPARIAAELVAVARYAMFRSVYLHDDVRAFAAMVRRALVLGFRTILRGKNTNDHYEFLAHFMSVGEEAALNYIIAKMESLNMPELKVSLTLLKALKCNKQYLQLAEIRGDEELAYEGMEKCFKLGDRDENFENECKRYLEGEKLIRIAVSEILGKELKEEDLVVDVPSRYWDKSREFKRMAVLDQFGRTQPVGNLWEAILDKVQAWVWKIRVFISPDYEYLISERRSERMREKLVDIFAQV